MKDNAFEMCMLFDFYGSVLTERQQEVFDLYYNEDLSLAEISEHTDITRQGIRDAIIRSKNILIDMENKLGLVARFTEASKAFKKISELSDELAELNRKRYRSPDFEVKLFEISTLAKQHI
jgi:predicted DNA-binding protein YlxM (UPF0122 family)